MYTFLLLISFILPLKDFKLATKGDINPVLAGLGTVGNPGNVVIWCKVGNTTLYS